MLANVKYCINMIDKKTEFDIYCIKNRSGSMNFGQNTFKYLKKIVGNKLFTFIASVF
jgi:hypothetical protein